MPIDYARLLAFPVPEIRQSYSEAQLVLYALGLNVGRDPMDERELRYVYEDGLVALPTAATILGYPGFWLKDERTGVDWKSVLHGEQSLVVHRPLPPAANVVGRTQVEDIFDKGARGAFIVSRRELRLAGSEELLCTLRQTTVARADGGFGGEDRRTAPPVAVPGRAPDFVHEHPTLPAQALLYRLNGDFNPLHADPAIAKAAGFQRPILHGLCTYGIAGFAIAATLCDWRAERIRRLDSRFTGPVFPGETVSTSVWKTGPGKASFRCTVGERQKTVMDYGVAEYEG
jgi:acyl dehydratase